MGQLSTERPIVRTGLFSLINILRPAKLFVMALLPLAVAACSTSVGPTRQSLEKAPAQASISGLQVIDVTQEVARSVNVDELEGNFAADLGGSEPIGTRVGVGDVLEITIWEAAPAALFGTSNLDSRIGSNVQASRPSTLPETVVGPSGTITVPFAGQVPAAGRTLRQIEQDIVARLRGRAHLPQAIVRIARNETANVTVLGDVKDPQRVPLTPRGERLLDVIAAAGGTNHPLDQMTVQITRGGIVQRMAARDVISDPRHNIVLQSNDVVTVLHQPYSFTVLGAAGKNEEVRFEGVGLTLSQALGRIGGLQDDRADPRGVFIFRWEEPEALGGLAAGAVPNAEGLVPVIYQVDMKQPETYFAAQSFRMRDGDVMYVANSRLAELQRFVNVLASSILPVSTVRNTVR
jgi:polysaccharide export outer membrane protein